MKMPEMTPVQSSNVLAVGYDSTTLTVFVHFLNGNVYNYKNVYPYERIQ